MNIRHISLLFITCFICSAILANNQDTITLDLLTAIDNFHQTEEGYWENTYIDGDWEADIFTFSHTGDSDGGGGMAYWEGFIPCTSGNNDNFGAEGSSDDWIANQWGCMAGGGLNDNLEADPERPYLVAYWGFFAETLDETYHSLKIHFNDNQMYKTVGTWICNHPWPYYGNINGDGFATAFAEGDSFTLVAHGLNEQGEPTGTTAQLTLAEYSNGKLTQSDKWQYFDLRSLGTVSGIYFTMETTDIDQLYGANTAVYFCMDRLSVAKIIEPAPLQRPTGLKADSIGENSIKLCWDKQDNAATYALWIDDQPAGETADTCFITRSLLAYTSYKLSVAAVNGADTSEVASITCQTIDLTPPTTPTQLTVNADNYSITLTWQPSEDNVEVRRYTIYLDQEPYKRTSSTSLTLTGLQPDTDYTIGVQAEDLYGNISEQATINAHTLPLYDSLELTESNQEKLYFSVNGTFLGTECPITSGLYIVIQGNNKSILVK